MPWVQCFRFLKPIPRRLLYRNGAIELEVVNVEGEPFPWRFRARKLNQAQTAVDICIAVTRWRLEQQLHSDGFDVEPTSSPAAKIMERLVHEGYAETARVKRSR